MSDVSVSPKKRRRWWVGLLVLLIAVGGGVWWCNRLTPDEQLLVGHWKESTPSIWEIGDIMVIHSDRTLQVHGTSYRWKIRNGHFAYRERHALLSFLFEGVQNGFGTWGGVDSGSGEIQVIDHDTVNIKIESGQSVNALKLKRIVER